MGVPERIWVCYHQYPALFFLTAFVPGIVTGWHFMPFLNFASMLALVGILYAAFALSPVRFSGRLLPVLFLLIFVCGSVRLYVDLAVFPAHHILNAPPGRIAGMEGTITAASIRENGKNRYLLSCDTITVDSVRRRATGHVLVYRGKLEQLPEVGTRMVIRDRPEYPALPGNPGAFNYRKYLQLNGTFLQYRIYRPDLVSLKPPEQSSFRIRSGQIRDGMVRRIERDFRAPTRDIVKALLLGVKEDLDTEILHDFQVTGVVHVLAISGLHVGFIVLMMSIILELFRLSFRVRIPFLLAGLAFYVVLVDFRVSVVRAALMAGIYFLSQAAQRDVKALNTMSAAALIILLAEPRQLFLPGFQFSFMAVGSILYGYEKIHRLLPGLPSGPSRLTRYLKGLRQAFAVSLAALLGTFPVTWYYYGYLPLAGVALNLLIIPLTGGLVLGGLFYFFLSIIPGTPLQGFLEILHAYCDGIVTLVQSVSRIPGLLIHLPAPSSTVLFYVMGVIGLLIHAKSRKARFLLYGWLILGITFSLIRNLYVGEPPLKVWFADVGQGDAILIRTPAAETIVVDGGESNDFTDKGRSVMLPLLRHYGMNRIRYLVVTHGHSDHIGGILSILQEMHVDTLIMSAYEMNTKLYRDVIETAEQKSVPVRRVARGDVLNAGSRVRMYVLHPWGDYLKARQFSGREVNNSSIVLALVHGDVRFLLTGDLESDAEPQLFGFGTLLRSDIIKAGHHGSKTSSSEALLQRVQPGYAVVSVGRYNRFKHPSRKTIERYRSHGAIVMRTDKTGAVCFESNGDSVKMVNWRLSR